MFRLSEIDQLLNARSYPLKAPAVARRQESEEAPHHEKQ